MRDAIRCGLLVVVAVALGYGHPASAETASSAADLKVSKRISAYFWSRPMQEAFFRLGVEQDRKLGLQAGCKSPRELAPINVTILAPVDLPDDKQNPVKGSWLFSYEFARCGESKTYNALLTADPAGGFPRYRAWYPGSTDADPVLVNGTMVTAVANATMRSGVNGCRDVDVLDMRVAAPRHGGAVGSGAWSELWTFKACGKTVDVPITFTQDGKGGTAFAIRK